METAAPRCGLGEPPTFRGYSALPAPSISCTARGKSILVQGADSRGLRHQPGVLNPPLLTGPQDWGISSFQAWKTLNPNSRGRNKPGCFQRWLPPLYSGSPGWLRGSSLHLGLQTSELKFLGAEPGQGELRSSVPPQAFQIFAPTQD